MDYGKFANLSPSSNVFGRVDRDIFLDSDLTANTMLQMSYNKESSVLVDG